MEKPQLKKTYCGHRSRLKEKFYKLPIRSLPDYEILELLLFYIFPRKDTKLIAKTLIKKFGSLEGIVGSEEHDIRSITGVGESVSFYIRLLNDFFSRLYVPVQKDGNHKIVVLSSWLSVVNYCQLSMGFKKQEYFRILFVNKKNVLIGDELLSRGTVDRIVVFPREIAQQALLHGASAVILVHNHPSGECSPSKEDIEVTQKILAALKTINIEVHDHIIVAHNNYFSFKGHNLI